MQHHMPLHQNGKVYAWGLNDCGQIANNLNASLAYPTAVERIYGEELTDKIDSLQKNSSLSYINNYIREDGSILMNGRLTPGLQGYKLSGNMLYVDEFESSYLEITDRISYIKLNETKKLNTQVIENFNMFAKVPEIGNIIWKSTNEDIATVDQNGNVTAKKTGLTTIIASEDKHGYKAMAKVYVTSNLEKTVTAPMVVQGTNFTGILKADGTVWMAGAGTSGKLGQGDATYRGELVQVKIDANTYLTDIVRISAGQHYMLAVTKTGEVYAWGQNNNGQLGNGTTANEMYAIKMRNPEGTGDLTNIIDVSAGTNHSLMLAKDGKVYAVGYANKYQLGINDTATKTLPVEMDKIYNAVEISAGTEYSVVLRGDGVAFGVGSGAYGQTGLDETGTKTVITAMKGKNGNERTKDIISVQAGHVHTIALTEDGEAYVCGYNTNGQLSQGTTTQSNKLIPALCKNEAGENIPLTGIISVVAGDTHTFALTKAGEVYAARKQQLWTIRIRT